MTRFLKQLHIAKQIKVGRNKGFFQSLLNENILLLILLFLNVIL